MNLNILHLFHLLRVFIVVLEFPLESLVGHLSLKKIIVQTWINLEKVENDILICGENVADNIKSVVFRKDYKRQCLLKKEEEKFDFIKLA